MPDIFDLLKSPDAASEPTASAPAREPDVFDSIKNPAEGYLQNRLADRVPWEDVEKGLKESFGDSVDTNRAGLNYRLEHERQKREGQVEGRGLYITRHLVPDFGAVGFTESRQYKAAKDRFDAGNASDEDLRVMAQIERNRQHDAERSTKNQLITTALSLPALATEFGVSGKALSLPGGKVGRILQGERTAPLLSKAGAVETLPAAGRLAATTATLPRFWLPGAAENAEKQGGDWYDAKNLGPAYALGTLQTAVLGSLAGRTKGLPLGARIPAATMIGMGEQQGADVVGSAIADVLNVPALSTHYGLLGTAGRGDREELAKHGLTQAVMFGAFSVMHGGDPKTVPDAYDAAYQKYRRMGLSPKEADARLGRAVDPVVEAINKNPTAPDIDAIKKAAAGAKGPGKDFAATVVESLPVDAWGNENTVGSRDVPPELGGMPKQPGQPELPGRIAAEIAAHAQRHGQEPPVSAPPSPEVPSPVPPGGPEPRPLLRPNLPRPVPEGPGRLVPPSQPGFTPKPAVFRDRAAARAAEAVKQGGKAVYVDMDVDNMAGLVAHAGEGPAHRHVAAMRAIIQEELAKTGAKVEVFRHSGHKLGDEHSAVVVGADKAAVDRALAAADARIGRYAVANRLANVQRPKLDDQGQPKKAGPQRPGITTGAEPFAPDVHWRDVIQGAEQRTETAKQRRAAPVTEGASAGVLGLLKRKPAEGDPNAGPHVDPLIGEIDKSIDVPPVDESPAGKERDRQQQLAVHREQLEQLLKTTKVKPVEREVVKLLLQGNTLDGVAALVKKAPGTRPSKTGLYTREGIRKIAERAMEKLQPGLSKKFHLQKEGKAANRSLQEQVDAIGSGEDTSIAELKKNPDLFVELSNRAFGKQKIIEVARRHIETQMDKEIADADAAKRTIDPKKLESYTRQITGLDGPGAFEVARQIVSARKAAKARTPAPSGGKEALMPKELLATRIKEAINRINEHWQNVSIADARELTRQFEALSKADQKTVTKAVGEDVHAGLNLLHETKGSMESQDLSHKSKYDVLGFSFGHEEGDKTSFVEEAAAKMLAAQMATTAAHQGITAMKNNSAAAPVGPDSPTIRERVKQFVQKLRDGFAELGGVMFPATQRKSVDTADGLARLVSAKDYGRKLAPDLIDKVFPDKVVEHADGTKTTQKVSDEFIVLTGVVGQERRLRYARKAELKKRDELLAKAKTLKDPEAQRAMRNEAYEWELKASKIKTLVGQPLEKGGDVLRNPLMTESDFQHFNKDPEVNAALERYKEHVVPIIEANYKKAEGLDPDAEIESITQIPDMPINSRAWRTGDDTSKGVVSFGGGRDLTAPKQQKLGFARQAKLSAEGYVLHFGDIIENSIARSTELAAKADAYRIAVAEGQAKWGRGSSPGEGYQWRLKVEPPKGTQVAGEGEHFLWFNDHGVFKDFVKALDPNPVPWKKFPLSGIFNKATLASLGEFTAHSKNLLTIMFRPGMGPINLIKNVRDVIRNTPEIRNRLLEMTRIGAMKPAGFEAQAGQLESKNVLLKAVGKPLKWTGQLLDILDSAMRLTADQAFTRNSLRVGKEATEGNRRDFINQLGQYNRRAQNWVVQFLRDTGIGPFATAGSTYFVNGLKALTLGHGMRGLDRNADLKMRGEMLLRMTTMLAAIPVINYFAWGRVDGDDNTPLGSVKIGTGTDGKTRYLDLANLTGLTRGARETGLLAFAEGTRPGAKKMGATTADSVDAARRDMFHSAIHPLTGPVVSAGYTAYKGENTLGTHIAARPETDAQLKRLGKTPEQRTSETTANLEAAAIHANPVIAALLQLADVDPGHTKPTTTQEEVFRQMGPFGLKERAMPPGAPHREMTIPNKSAEQQKAFKPLKPVLKK